MDAFNYADQSERQRVAAGTARTGIVCVYSVVPESQQSKELRENLKDDEFGQLAAEKHSEFKEVHAFETIPFEVENRLYLYRHLEK